MAHWKWRRRRRTVIDPSAVRPEPRRYVAPRWDEELVRSEDYQCGVRVHYIRRRRGRRLVDFAVTLSWWTPPYWRQVARFDTAHGNVHLHRFHPDGTDERLIYREIDPDRATEMLERWYDRCCKMMDAGWWDLVKEWIDETD